MPLRPRFNEPCLFYDIFSNAWLREAAKSFFLSGPVIKKITLFWGFPNVYIMYDYVIVALVNREYKDLRQIWMLWSVDFETVFAFYFFPNAANIMWKLCFILF